MNLLLLRPEELNGNVAELSGRRAHHVYSQLKKGTGEHLSVGVLGASSGNGRVLSVAPDRLVLELVDQVPVAPPSTALIVAIPRPKALSRLIQHAASFGLSSLSLVRTARVEASYLTSKRLTPHRLEEDLLLGLEQGRQVHLPQVNVYSSLRKLLVALGNRPASHVRLVLHPAATNWMHQTTAVGAQTTLALGPDGGFLADELATLEASGFLPVRLGTPTLRTEAAVSAALGQLALCRHLALQEA